MFSYIFSYSCLLSKNPCFKVTTITELILTFTHSQCPLLHSPKLDRADS